MRVICLSKMWSWMVFFLMLIFAVSTAAADVPFEPYGRLPAIEDIAISPDGTYLALVKSVNEQRVLYVLSLKGAEIKGACRVGDTKLRGITWADEKNVLLMVSTTSGPPLGFMGNKAEFAMLLSYDISAKKIYNVLNIDNSFSELILNNIIGLPSVRRINGETVLFVMGLYVQDRTMPALFKVNLTTQHLETVAHGNKLSRGWLVDENGEIMASQTYDDKRQQWTIAVRKDGQMITAASGKEEIEYPTISGISPVGDAIWVKSIGDDDPTWSPISFKSGVMGDPLQETQGFRGLAVDPYSDRIIGGFPLSSDTDIVFFDPQRQAAWETVKNKFPGEHVTIASASSDYQKLALLIDGKSHGYAYYFMDLASYASSRIGDIYDGLSGIAEVRPIEYTAADGMKIPGYLTLPMKREHKNLPLVVLPHGGPAARDTGHFDWWAQALASQGYAVLQPNFRGSDLNWKFLSAGFGEWGRKMQTDLSDGVRYLVKDGIVDADRVCIVGASYGGYAALAGATLDAGVYRCAISVAGISDLGAMMKYSAKKTNVTRAQTIRYWDRFFGTSGSKDPILKTLSPLEFAEKVSIPIMLIHGRDDTVVPYKQSELFANALKRAKKSFELMELKEEDHWLSKSETRLQMLQETIRFLKAHNPPY